MSLGLGSDIKPTGREPTLEVNCANCGAKFVAYDYDEDNVEAVEVRSCGLVTETSSGATTSKGATIRPLAEVTSRR
jgi:hypothetical protein